MSDREVKTRQTFKKWATDKGFAQLSGFPDHFIAYDLSAWSIWQAALASRASTPTEGPVTYHKAEDDTFWIVHSGFCIAHVKNFAPDAPEALDWAQKIVIGLNRQIVGAEGVGKQIVDEFEAELDRNGIEWDDLGWLEERIDRALAAPRMRLDLRGPVTVYHENHWFIRMDQLKETIRQQLPNVEVVTE